MSKATAEPASDPVLREAITRLGKRIDRVTRRSARDHALLHDTVAMKKRLGLTPRVRAPRSEPAQLPSTPTVPTPPPGSGLQAAARLLQLPWPLPGTPQLQLERLFASYLHAKEQGAKSGSDPAARFAALDALYEVLRPPGTTSAASQDPLFAVMRARYQAAHWLGLSEAFAKNPRLSKAEIQRAFAQMIQRVHPDHGGSSAQVQQVIEARNQLLAIVEG